MKLWLTKKRIITAELLFEPRDLWVGVYWTKVQEPKTILSKDEMTNVLKVFICVVPCFPILVEIGRRFRYA